MHGGCAVQLVTLWRTRVKKFTISGFFFSIVIISWDLPEDTLFPPMDKDLSETAQFTSLYETKDAMCITKTKFFWVLMEARIRMPINKKPWLSPIVLEQLSKYMKFKDDFHCIYIRTRKDPQQKWFDLPYLTIEDVI